MSRYRNNVFNFNRYMNHLMSNHYEYFNTKVSFTPYRREGVIVLDVNICKVKNASSVKK